MGYGSEGNTLIQIDNKELSAQLAENAKVILNAVSPPDNLTPIKADGTDDLTSLQSIIDYASTYSAIVKLPPKTIGLSAPFKLKSNVTIEGVKGTTIKALAGFTGAIIEPPEEIVTNAVIKDVILDADKTNNPSTSNMCLKFTNAFDHKDVYMENVTFLNSPYHGVHLGTGSSYVFNNCNFINNGTIDGGNGHGAGIFGSVNDVKFILCKFDGNYEHGVYSNFSDVIFDTCSVTNNGANGLSVRGKNTRVHKCYFSQNGETNPTYGSNGLAISSTYGRVNGVFITDCIFENQKAGGGIFMDSDIENIIVDNNIFKQDSFFDGRAMNLTGGGASLIAKNIGISNNVISNHITGIYVQFDAFDSLKIIANTIIGDASYDIKPVYILKNSSSTNIMGDMFVAYGNIMKICSNPIILDTSAILNKVRIYGNIRTETTDSLTTSVSNQSGGSDQDVESYSSKTVISVDFGTVTAHSSSDEFVTIPLAGYDCFATLTPTATSLPDGIMFMPISRGNSGNSLTIRAVNVTATDITVGAITFSIEIKKD